MNGRPATGSVPEREPEIDPDRSRGTDAAVVYLATRDLPGMIELIEHTDAQERVYAEIYRAAVDWDGRDPIRRNLP